MNKFGDRLKNARKLKGLTQKELADMINAKHNSVSNWENNHNKPDPDTIELLCGVLDVSPNYLLGVSSPEILNDEVILLNQYRQLDETGKRELLQQIPVWDECFPMVGDLHQGGDELILVRNVKMPGVPV